jgi:hypothetical protein
MRQGESDFEMGGRIADEAFCDSQGKPEFGPLIATDGLSVKLH